MRALFCLSCMPVPGVLSRTTLWPPLTTLRPWQAWGAEGRLLSSQGCGENPPQQKPSVPSRQPAPGLLAGMQTGQLPWEGGPLAELGVTT